MMSRLSARVCAGIVASVLVLVTGCGGSSKKDPQVSTVALTADRASLAKGTSAALNAKAVYDNSTVVDVTAQAHFSSADAAIVSIEGTRAVAKGVGTAKVSAAFAGKVVSMDLTVTAAELTGLAVSPGSVELAAGLQKPLTVTGTFSDQSTQDVTAQATWASSAGDVAAVVNATVEARKVGAATVTAAFGGKSATASVKVTAAALKKLAIEAAVKPVNLIAGQPTVALGATGFFTDSTTADVTSTVTWSSSDSDVVAVVGGVLTPKAKGKATISVAHGQQAAAVEVNVADAQLIAVEIEGTKAELPRGLTIQLKAVGKYDNGKVTDVSAAAAWDSSNTAIATVNAVGLVTASKANDGDVRITAQYGGFGGVYNLEVTDAVIVKIDVAPATLSLPAGLNRQFTATAHLSDGSTPVDVTSSAAWSTTDSSVATVGAATGVVAAVKPGDVQVKASKDGVTGAADLTVSDAALVSIEISPATPPLLPWGLTLQFKATGHFTDKTTHEITKRVVWTSSNEGAVTISNWEQTAGLASANNYSGFSTIRALDPKTNINASVQLQVTQYVFTKLDLSCADAQLPMGYATQCKVIGTPSVPGYPTYDLTNAVTWTAKPDSDCAKVSSSGLVTTDGAKPVCTTTIEVSFAQKPYWVDLKASTTVKITDAVLDHVVVMPAPAVPGNAPAPLLYPVPFVAEGHMSDGSVLDVTKLADWSLDQPSVCTIAGSVVMGNAKGFCGVNATMAAASSPKAVDGKITGSYELEIKNWKLSYLYVYPQSNSMARGLTAQYVAYGYYVDMDDAATPVIAYRDFTKLATWSTHDWPTSSNVAAVSNDAATAGLVAAKNVGTADINVVDPITGFTASGRLDVTPAVLQKLEITPLAETVIQGLKKQFKVVGTYSDQTTVDLTTQVNWTATDVSGTNVASIDAKGVATGLNPGKADVSASFQGVTATKASSLEVTKKQLVSLRVWANAGATTIEVGQNVLFLAYGTYTDGSEVELTQFVAWDSSDAKIAQVSNATGFWGLATGIAPGTVTITAVDVATGINASVPLAVTAAP